MTKLKPCPFCGGEARRESTQVLINGELNGSPEHHTAFCTKCPCMMPFQNWNDHLAPKLPDGYRVEEKKGVMELWHVNSNHCLVAFSDEVFFFNPVYPKDAPSVIAFLKGAR